jgi:uncharacterized protein (DUF885 family)
MKRLVALSLGLLLAASAARAFDPETARREIWERIEQIDENPDGRAESERLQEFIDVYFDYIMLEHPEFATFLGLPEGHDRWTDNSLEAITRRDEDTVRALEVLRSIDRGNLVEEDRLDYDLLLRDLEEEVAGQRFHGEYLAISQMDGVQQNAARLLSMMPARNVEQYADILSRLRGVSRLVDQTLVRLEKGLEKGVTPPKVTLRDVPEQVQNQLVEDPLASPLLRAFTQFPESISAEDQERLTAEAVRIYTEDVQPAFSRLHEYLVETYIPQARKSTAMSELPDGREWYAHNVKSMTTTDLTPQEIHEIGLSEVDRIRKEMEKIIAETSFEGSFEDFFDFLRRVPQFFYDDPEDLLRGYRDIAKRDDAELVKMFGKLPRPRAVFRQHLRPAQSPQMGDGSSHSA